MCSLRAEQRGIVVKKLPQPGERLGVDGARILKGDDMMDRLWLAAALAFAVSAANAQTMPKGSTNQATNAGAPGVAARMQAQGYSDVRNLRRGPDGTWVGEAKRNGVTHTMTANPDGSITAR